MVDRTSMQIVLADEGNIVTSREYLTRRVHERYVVVVPIICPNRPIWLCIRGKNL
jgi:hypothetical protein